MFSVMVLGLACVGSAYSASFNDIVVYGDSLSDNGNVFKVTSMLGIPTPPSPPYFEGRFSNGPVAVENVASYFGVPLLDFAYGGATTGIGDEGDGGSVASMNLLPGITSQFAASKNQIAPIASSSLFVVWGGPDDLLAPTPGQTNPVDIANTAAANIIKIVNGLEVLGAKQILVPGIPDLGVVPDYASDAVAARLFATTFNSDLIAGLPKNATYVDTYSLLDELVANPSAAGFTNVTTPCVSGSSVCANPNQYLFWDGQHPTEAVHLLVAQAMEAAAVPEPGTALLGLSALGVLALIRRRLAA
jgi:MYXO-CTERM domain-containing protein